ncbi:hypothetical protein OM076_18895 [Solirubrobacter ginsenosidimutans]|uniref:Uncharacterized protein n=1 Tax=Solirubrobacter ginsenosidimutans TaxID=490573 RepID=A0A9X3S2J6_9ACTN|nr:hypothetical protein [Solirubrobacter ginsenosidimutans]MDA0162347.1 hypothetical protein [Solirubrobacter ginsenosidimutans]
MRHPLGLLLLAVAVAMIWPASAGAEGEAYVIAGGGRVRPADIASAPATELRLAVESVIAAHDGGLLIAGGDVVLRMSVLGRASRVAGGLPHGDRGEGGPALTAHLRSAGAVTEAADGTLFVATDRTVRRIAPDGTIMTVAGGGPLYPPPLGEPLPALYSKLAPTALALGPDGSLWIADDEEDSGLLTLSADGLLRAVAPVGPSDDRCVGRAGSLAPSAGGLLVGFAYAVCRVDAAGVRTVFAGDFRPAELVLGRIAERPVALPGGDVALLRTGSSTTPGTILRVTGSPPHAVRVPLQADGVNLPLSFSAYELGVAADGGLLASDGKELVYLAPERPGLAALRFEPGSRRSLALRSTLPGHVRLRLDGPQTAHLTATLGGGVGHPRLPGRLRPGLYRIVGDLRTPSGARTTARTALVLGGTLTDRAAARVLGLPRLPLARAAGRTRDENPVIAIDRCRRWSRTRVDCRSMEHDQGEPRPYCLSLQAVQLSTDGTVTSRPYDCPARGAFLLRPHFTHAAVPVDLRAIAERWRG